MAVEPEYDLTLTRRLEDELSHLEPATGPTAQALRTALDRIEARLGTFLAGHDLDRALTLLRPAPAEDSAGTGVAPRPTGPLAAPLLELLAMSRQLDQVDATTQGLAIGEHVARRAYEAARALDGVLKALDPAEAIAPAFHRILAYASELIRNAIARIRQFARRLGVTSVSVTLASLPPEVSITFACGMDAA